MNSLFIVGFVLAVGCGLQAQSGNPLIAEAKQMYTSAKTNVLGSAEKMPDENYSYKPTPEVRSFAEVIGHITTSQMGACAAVAGDTSPASATAKTSKSEVVAALQQSFAECDKAFDSMNETTAMQMISSRRGQRSKLGMLIGIASHDNEQYGIMTVYLRLKGLVPPASEK